jgi:hypothetical protein
MPGRDLNHRPLTDKSRPDFISAEESIIIKRKREENENGNKQRSLSLSTQTISETSKSHISDSLSFPSRGSATSTGTTAPTDDFKPGSHCG